MKTNMINIKNMGRTALIAALAMGAASCTDRDVVDSPAVPAGREISFAVREASGWNNIGSRSGAVPFAGPMITLTGGAEKLYLIPEVSEGIEMGAAGSRGNATDSESIETAGVYASHRDGQTELAELTPGYMFNVEVTRSGDWTPAREYLWPGSGNLHINAYSPYSSETATEGLTELPTADSACPLSVGFKTPADVAQQFDLMYATPVDASASPCALSFNHALTAIRFATGSEMAPCTVKSISVSGVADTGRLSLETGQWTAVTGASTYSITPDIALEAADGSTFAAAGTALTPDGQTMLLIPQTLTESSAIELVVASGGVESSFTASLEGQTWTAGTTVTYRLSANPSHPGLTLEVLDAEGNPLTEITSSYTGGKEAYTVRSYYSDGTDGDAQTPIEWDAEFVDAAGMPIEMPVWITSVTTEGTDNTAANIVMDLPDPTFLAMSENTRTLRNAADINTSSGQARYNLANSTGAPAVENTANCYVINAPGKYSLPLVYGNAVENGATNEASYISTLENTTANAKVALFHFVNHLGNEITDPYIYNNAGCTPASADMMWEDRLNLVRNVALSADGRSIEFDVPASSIRQGNAVVCVRDADGTVLWSWHLWITDYDPTSGLIPVPHTAGDGTSYIYARNLGGIYGGDRTEFEAAEVTMRLTQKNVPADMTPLSTDVKVTRQGVVLTTGTSYSFFQFGRKDPMVTGLDQYYDTEHNELDPDNIPKKVIGTNGIENIKDRIQHPSTFFTGTTADLSKISPFYINLWDIDQVHTSATGTRPENVKTIYDPSPVGAKVPIGNVFITLQSSGTPYHFDSATNTGTFDVDGNSIEIMAMGYRSDSGGEVGNKGTSACWVAMGRSATSVQYFYVNSTRGRLALNTALYGFAVRPVKE